VPLFFLCSKYQNTILQEEMGMAEFGHGSEALDIIKGFEVDLKGKTAIVTGAASGLGVETARALAAAGASLVLPVRDVVRGEKVAEEIRASTGNPNISVSEMDLIDFDSVRAFVSRFLEDHDELHILINNAGVMATPLRRSPEGYEGQFATNHLGHFLLSGLLIPALKAGAPSRVVALSSIGHRISPVVFSDIHFKERDYEKWLAYGQAKTANALFAVEFDKRLNRDGVHAYSVHPGGIMTNLQRDMSHEEINAMGWLDADGNPREGFKTPAGGAATAVWAATAPELEVHGGVYCEDCHIAEPVQDGIPFAGIHEHAQDPDQAARLWAVSEEMLGETFG
jgi:NAD(P)-dependent dehydrogenase (short-subunit alcohol dehydrogenase family)